MTKKSTKKNNPLYTGFYDADRDFILEIFIRMEAYARTDRKDRGSFFAFSVPFNYTKKRDYAACDMLFEKDHLWKTILIRTEDFGDGSPYWRDNLSNIEFIDYLATNYIGYFRSFGFLTQKEVDALLEEYFRDLSNARKSANS